MYQVKTSEERVAKEAASVTTDKIDVSRLVKEMDFSNLSPTNCRIVTGVHLYADISNFNLCVKDSTLSDDEYARLIRCLDAYQREFTRIVKAFDGVKIHFQGSRLHALFHKPYDDNEKLIRNAYGAAVAMMVYIDSAFNVKFDHCKDFRLAVGMDFGDALLTNIGQRGSRELISLGAPANVAAKILGPGKTVRATSAIVDALADTYRDDFEEIDSDVANVLERANGGWRDVLDSLLKDTKVDWTFDGARERLDKYVADHALSRYTCQEARVKIDLNALTPFSSKKTEAATVFVDIDGFTAMVAGAFDNKADLKELVRVLHLSRREFTAIATADYADGIRIQFQGDRMQAILHLPRGEQTKISEKWVEAALAIQTSVRAVLRNYLPSRIGTLEVATGIAYGQLVLTRTGDDSDSARDVICLGESVDAAERLQGSGDGDETIIGKDVYKALEDDAIKECFEPANTSATKYKSTKDFRNLQAKRSTKQYERAGAVAAVTSDNRIVVGTERPDSSRMAVNTKPWLSDVGPHGSK